MKNYVDLELVDDIPALVTQAQEYCDKSMWPFARQTLEKLFALGHDAAKTAQHLGDVCGAEGDATEAIMWHRRALDIDPQRYPSQEHLIFLLDAQQDTTEADAWQVRRDWWDRFGAAAYARRLPHTNWAHPEKRLRVGYVGGDFNFHSAAIAFVNVITNHSSAIEPVFYSTLEPFRYDHRTKLWKERYGAAFVDASAMSASLLANTIREDQIDILVDLAGYTGNNRLLTFAERPAPIQIQAWGYVLGTASPAIDVVFADKVVASPAIRASLTERVVDLPAVLSYQPRPDLPEATPLPCLAAPPLFSVFQRAMKVTGDAIAVWREILQRVPGSQILFKGGDYSPLRKDVIADAFGEFRGRIMFDFAMGHRDHMLSYQDIDLALDCWPQTGGVSTLEALWMGVPTVTLLGERMIQRASASFLTCVGFDEWCVATTVEDYIAKAVALVTTERETLAWMRAHARNRLQTSPIMVGYVDAVEAAYRALWREWCATQAQTERVACIA